MKKLIGFLFILSAHFSYAQGTYMKVNIGYAVPSGSQYIASEGSSNFNYNDNTGEYTYKYSEKGIYGSLGSGFNVGTSIGYKFNKFIAADFELNYLMGKKYQANDKDNSYGYSSSSSTEIKGKSFSMTPSIIIFAGESKIQPYLKAGLVLGKNKVKAEFTEDSEWGNSSRVAELSGGLSIGFKGGVGLEFNATKKTTLYTEVVFTSMSYYPKKGEVTEYTVDGVNRLDEMSTSERKVEFVKEINVSSSNGYNENSPSKSLRQSMAFGSIGLQFGIRFNLGKTTDE